jgi:hypothetical protein
MQRGTEWRQRAKVGAPVAQHTARGQLAGPGTP